MVSRGGPYLSEGPSKEREGWTRLKVCQFVDLDSCFLFLFVHVLRLLFVGNVCELLDDMLMKSPGKIISGFEELA